MRDTSSQSRANLGNWVGDIRMGLSCTNQAMKVEMTKVPTGWNLMINNPKSWHSWNGGSRGKTESESDSQSVGLATKVHPNKCTIWMVETIENVLISHKAKLLGYRRRCEEIICTLSALAKPWFS